MNWWAKFLALLLLNTVLYPYAVAAWLVLGWAAWHWHWTITLFGWHVPVGASSRTELLIWCGVMLLPTVWLLAGIAIGGKRLPRWAWQFDTPDATLGSPYSQQEGGAAPYYAFTALGPFVQRVVGDYRWFAMRNLWYGIAFRWGLRPDASWTFQHTGDPYTADTDPKTRKYVLGKLVILAFKDGKQVGWCRRGTLQSPLLRGKFLKYWWGWKLAEYVQPNTKPVPPAMIAMQIELRSLDTVGGV